VLVRPFTPFTAKRRAATVGRIAVVGLLLALCAGALTYFGLDDERIRGYQVDVAVQADGTALVRETIDYDFGTNSRHGIFRDFPGYRLDGEQRVSDVRVRSASAPDTTSLTDDGHAVIRVGDPERTVSGLHRYVLEYRVTGVTSGDRLAFDAVGTAWDVPVDRADVRLTAPYRLGDVRCYRGPESSTARCAALDAGGDVVTAHVEDLAERQGVTIAGTRAGALSGPVRAALPGDVDPRGGGDGRSYWTTVWLVLGLGAAGFALGVVPVALWARRAGRDRAGAGGGVTAVAGGTGRQAVPVADRTAEQQVTTRVEPPRDLTPAQGGVLLTESVERRHQVAWLTQQSLDGWFTIENDGRRLRWTAPDDRWAAAPEPLKRMFNRRARLKLGKYDQRFAEGFRMVGDELKHWRATCELWDHDAERRNRRTAERVKVLAVLVVLAGAVLLLLTASGEPRVACLAAAVAGFFAGAGTGMWFHGSELPVRTPEGFARRQLVEGFRRFLAASGGREARDAAERGELRRYSAWAVALGELDRWNAAMTAASLPPATAGVAETTSFAALTSTVHTATTSPPSSGSAGGGSSGGGYSGGGYSGGGDVGGGGGGGGGGSW
jgi:uncharacterized membrane protein YgcG